MKSLVSAKYYIVKNEKFSMSISTVSPQKNWSLHNYLCAKVGTIIF